jgi:hypothetical protein
MKSSIHILYAPLISDTNVRLTGYKLCGDVDNILQKYTQNDSTHRKNWFMHCHSDLLRDLTMMWHEQMQTGDS